jgi:hypothetical protein
MAPPLLHVDRRRRPRALHRPLPKRRRPSSPSRITSSSPRAACPTAAHEPPSRTDPSPPTAPPPPLATDASSPPLVSSARMEARDGAGSVATTAPREARFVFCFFSFFKMQLHVI